MGLNDDNLRSAFCVPNSYFQINVVNVSMLRRFPSIIRHSNQSVYGNRLLIKMHFEANPDNDAEVGISIAVIISLKGVVKKEQTGIIIKTCLCP